MVDADHFLPGCLDRLHDVKLLLGVEFVAYEGLWGDVSTAPDALHCALSPCQYAADLTWLTFARVRQDFVDVLLTHPQHRLVLTSK